MRRPSASYSSWSQKVPETIPARLREAHLNQPVRRRNAEDRFEIQLNDDHRADLGIALGLGPRDLISFTRCTTFKGNRMECRMSGG